MKNINIEETWCKLTLHIISLKVSTYKGFSVSIEYITSYLYEENNFTDDIQFSIFIMKKGLNLYEDIKNVNFSPKIDEILIETKDIGFKDSNNAFERRIKAGGEVWVIHQNDIDPFPSSPHAHNYDSNLKLDLSNGLLYKKKEQVASIPKKKLEIIRKKCEELGITLPALNI